MEYNRDESIKCFKLANDYLAKGDKDKALKFARKSDKLYPSVEAKGKVGYYYCYYFVCCL